MPPKRKLNNINKDYIDSDDEGTSKNNNNNNETLSTTLSSPSSNQILPINIDNNKKIKIDEEINDDTINNNNNTTTTITTTTTNNNDLNKKTKNELIKIAKSMGINTLTGNKNDLITRIENSIESYKSSNRVQNKQQTALVNRFDTSVYDLKNKEIDKTELLFWKIFRNKWLFQYLSKFLKDYNFQFDSFGYNYFINVRKMVLSNNDNDNSKMELIKDKIITNRSLVFDSTTAYSNEYMVKLFKYFKNDKSFFQNLFKNYLKQINGTTTASEFDRIIRYAIESNSIIVVLKILIEQYNYKPSVKSTLFQAIYKKCSIKTLQFIIDKIGINQVQDELNENLDEFYNKYLLKSVIDEGSSNRYSGIDEFKIQKIKEMTEWTYYQMTPPTIDPSVAGKLTIHRFKLINYLISNNFISNTTIIKSIIKESFNIGPIEKQFKLKDLINSCKSILILNFQTTTTSNLNFTLNDLNLIELKLKKLELNSILLNLFDDNENGLKYRNNQDIKKLFEFYLKQSTITNNMIYYYLIYGNATIEQFENIPTSLFYFQFNQKSPQLNYLYYSLKVGSWEFLSVYFQKVILDNAGSLYSMYIPKIENILFSQINNVPQLSSDTTTSSERKIKFISIYIEFCKEIINFTQILYNDGGKIALHRKYVYPLYYLFCLILESDDIKLIQEFHRITNGEFTFFTNFYKGFSYYYCNQYNALHYCKSPDMAEFLFNHYRQDLFEPVLCPYQQRYVVFLDFSWYFSGSIEILKRMESIIEPKDYSKYLPSIHNKEWYGFHITPAITPSTITKTMCHMIDNPSIYQPLKEEDLLHLSTIANDEKSTQDIKYIIENTNLNYNIFELFPQQETHHRGKAYGNFKFKRQLLHWVHETRQDDLKSGRYKYTNYGIDHMNNSKRLTSLYLINRMDQLFSDVSFNDSVNFIGQSFNYHDAALYDKIALAIATNGDINSFERILKMNPDDVYNKFKLKKTFIYTVLYKSIEIGRIEILDYIFDNYKQFLEINSKKVSSGLFDQKEFKTLVALAISQDHLPIVDFFFNILGFKLPSPQLTKIFRDSLIKDIVYSIYNSSK